MIHLEKIGYSNMQDVLQLDVFDYQQGFVSSTADSIIDAYLSVTNGEHTAPLAIYDDGILVGFTLVQFGLHGGQPIERVSYNIRRFLIDKKYQHKGYGRKALGLVIDFVSGRPWGDAEYCCISFKPWNTVAKRLYNSMGFEDTGVYDGDELIAARKM